MKHPRSILVRVSVMVPALLAALSFGAPAIAQDFATVYESQDFPLENRSRTVIVEEDLRPRSYFLVMAPRTRVVDNHAEVVARREGPSFDERFDESVKRQEEIYALYRRLSR
jgi:hypothetical protein